VNLRLPIKNLDEKPIDYLSDASKLQQEAISETP
jgi:hypothetical protein